MKRKDFLKIVGTGLVGALFTECDIFFPEEGYSYRNISEKIISSGYNRPVGLSQGSLYFMDMPSCLVSNGEFQPIFTKRPTLYKNSSLDDSEPVKIFEFGQESFNDFWDGYDLSHPTISEIKSRGLFLDTLVLSEEEVLISSNVSDKIFSIINDKNGNYSLNPVPFAQGEDIIGIDEMIMGSDGLIYATQSGIEGTTADGPFPYIRKPRVISLDPITKQVIQEFLLRPSSNPKFENVYGQCGINITLSGYDVAILELGKKHAIIENSIQGRSDTGIRFFVSSYLDNMVLAADESNLVSIVSQETDFFPTSLQISKRGDLFVAKAPINVGKSSYSNSGINYILSGETKRKNLHTFNDNPQDYKTGMFSREGVPSGFDIKTLLVEDSSKLDIYLTNTHTGDLKIVSADKD